MSAVPSPAIRDWARTGVACGRSSLVPPARYSLSTTLQVRSETTSQPSAASTAGGSTRYGCQAPSGRGRMSATSSPSGVYARARCDWRGRAEVAAGHRHHVAPLADVGRLPCARAAAPATSVSTASGACTKRVPLARLEQPLSEIERRRRRRAVNGPTAVRESSARWRADAEHGAEIVRERAHVKALAALDVDGYARARRALAGDRDDRQRIRR